MRSDDMIIYSLLFVLGILSVIDLVLKTQTSTNGIILAQLEARKLDQEAQNGEVRQDLLEAQSYTYIDQKARSWGMIPGKFIFIYE